MLVMITQLCELIKTQTKQTMNSVPQETHYHLISPAAQFSSFPALCFGLWQHCHILLHRRHCFQLHLLYVIQQLLSEKVSLLPMSVLLAYLNSSENQPDSKKLSPTLSPDPNRVKSSILGSDGVHIFFRSYSFTVSPYLMQSVGFATLNKMMFNKTSFAVGFFM